MISQEVQTLSCLLAGQTGLIGKFPADCPPRVVFTLEDGTSLHLLGFNACHPSIIPEPGQKKVAGFATGRGKRLNPRENWHNLTESANAVLFTKKGGGYEVEILRRANSPASANNRAVTVCFQRTGQTDEFIPRR